MSAIASFIKMPKSALDGLRAAAVPEKRWFGTARDTYHDYLREHGESVADYLWSGYVMATLLEYLEEERQISLANADDEGGLGTFLTESRGSTHLILTDAHKRSFLAKLDEPFSEEELRDYCNEFHGTEEADAGKPMLDGIRALRQSLGTLDENSVIVLSIG